MLVFYFDLIVLICEMERLKNLIENNPGLFRIIGVGLGLLIGYLFFLRAS